MLALLVATRFIYRYHTRRLLELERVRTRIATDLHDDIGASLSKIAILSDVAGQQLATMSDSPVAVFPARRTTSARGVSPHFS